MCLKMESLGFRVLIAGLHTNYRSLPEFKLHVAFVDIIHVVSAKAKAHLSQTEKKENLLPTVLKYQPRTVVTSSKEDENTGNMQPELAGDILGEFTAVFLNLE